ncbi:MAG: MFS transporter [Solirubrobacterales bacterium]|nr:MFS transporter [Solirubrobacterales bacterium]
MSLRTLALSGAVGLVLADSSIVVLALPEIFRQFDTGITEVAWVLIIFNLVLALLAVPGARAARRFGPGRSAAIGLAVFAGGSLVCGLATGLGPLLTGRAVQAAGGAVAITAALELLVSTLGSDRRAIATWVGAGAIGAAVGPGLGGVLTELVSWQSIFFIQVPVAILAGVPLREIIVEETREWKLPAAPADAHVEGRPHLPANIALALVSAAIAATLFLIVLLLIEGWLLTPIEAALVVTVLPVAALAGSRLGSRVESERLRAASGAILLAGGLAALGLLPRASIALVIPPQVLAGVGLALVLSALTEAALHGRSEASIHGGWTISARHAGVVVGLLILTPIFTNQLERQQADALDAGTAILLDSPISTSGKIELGGRLAEQVDTQRDRVPDIAPAFEPYPTDPVERDGFEQVLAGLEDQLKRAATHAFSSSFLLAAVFSLIALFPISLTRRLEL